MSKINRFVRFGYRRPPPWKPSNQGRGEQSKGARAPSSILEAVKTNTIKSWSTIATTKLPLNAVPEPQRVEVPSLAHGVETVLGGDGLYPLEAPWVPNSNRNRHRFTSNPSRTSPLFSDGLRRIVQPENFAWEEIPSYVPAKDDSVLHHIAQRLPDVLFCSSTSSITPTLSAMYHVISRFRDTALNGGLSNHLQDLPTSFSKMHRRPVAFTISRNPNPLPSLQSRLPSRAVYTINAHNGLDRGPTILKDLGHSMERMLTTPPEQFANKFILQRMRDCDSCVAEGQEEHLKLGSQQQTDQYYHYTQASSLLLRAQIDCMDRATGDVFDLKTRAVAPIRYDLENYGAFTSHRIRYLSGATDSYEREFYDMVRSVFLKYAFQLRIGRMAGALVAYHNTTEVLGLEYIKLSEMESYIFGCSNWANVAFATSVRLLEEVLNTVLARMGVGDRDDEKLKVVLYTEWMQMKMFVFVQRVRKDKDPFGCEEFLEREKAHRGSQTTSDVEAFRCSGQWHLDSFLHGRYDGIAAVGAHKRFQMLGGVAMDQQGHTASERRVGGYAQSLDRRLYDCDSLTPDMFRVWELTVIPLVNGEVASRLGVSMTDGDDFTVKYKLSEVCNVDNEHLSKFIMGLGSIYLR